MERRLKDENVNRRKKKYESLTSVIGLNTGCPWSVVDVFIILWSFGGQFVNCI